VTYDLFISYSSADRPWAAKLFQDLSAAYPALRIFWDRAAIPAGGRWRTLLTDANVHTKHLLFLWSAAAKNSIEVEPEIAAFEAEVRRTPVLEDSQRIEFYVPLEGARGGGIQDLQGFPDFAAYYDPKAQDRGVSGVGVGQGSIDWKRMIRMVGDAVSNASKAVPIVAAVVAVGAPFLPLLDSLHSLPTSPNGPTLDQFLADYRLDWPTVRARYGANALEWRPFGGPETVVDLLEGLRVQANSRLASEHRFRWTYVDVGDAVAAGTLAQRVTQRPSVVFVDPVSLYNPYHANAFKALDDYVRQEHSAIISFAPVGAASRDWFASALRFQSEPLLNDYFEPKVPLITRHFAQCVYNVQRITDVERVVRHRIAFMDLASRTESARDTTGMVR
jgi:hypothetical protein